MMRRKKRMTKWRIKKTLTITRTTELTVLVVTRMLGCN
jgi:hypothetical protein